MLSVQRSSTNNTRTSSEPPMMTDDQLDEELRSAHMALTGCCSANRMMMQELERNDPQEVCTTTTTTTTNGMPGIKRPHKSTQCLALASLLAEAEAEVYGTPSSTSTTLSSEPDTAMASRSVSPTTTKEEEDRNVAFGRALQDAFGSSCRSGNSHMDAQVLRQALEPHLRPARQLREHKRRTILRTTSGHPGHGPTTASHATAIPLSSWVGLPYPSLRHERAFLYDHRHTHPLGQLLQDALGVDDLSQLHQTWDPTTCTARQHQHQLCAPLVANPARFQHAYQSFVTSACIPLLHATALAQNLFAGTTSTSTSHNNRIVYRYPVFPTINIVYPHDEHAARAPTCGISQGQSVGWWHIHVPLTASTGTSALHVEGFPGREDWHALPATSPGLAFGWDGARCLHFCPVNTTKATRVSLDVRILLVRAGTLQCDSRSSSTTSSIVRDDALCQAHHLEDDDGPQQGYCQDVALDLGAVGFALGATAVPGANVIVPPPNDDGSGTANPRPDARCGFPFA